MVNGDNVDRAIFQDKARDGTPQGSCGHGNISKQVDKGLISNRTTWEDDISGR